MDFSLSDDQRVIGDLARQIFRDQVTDQRQAELVEPIDKQLWSILADAGLIAVSMAERNGGLGLGFIAQCLVLQEMGGVLARVPLMSTMLAAAALEWAEVDEPLAGIAAGNGHLALSSAAGLAVEEGRLSGTLDSVLFADGATHIVACAEEQLVAFSTQDSGCTLQSQQLSNGLPASRLEIDDVPFVSLGGEAEAARLRQMEQVATASIQLGVVEEAMQRTAAYTTERKQFGRPIAAFQAVAHRAADAYMDVEALRATRDSAMWRLDSGLDADLQAGAAMWWAAEAGHRVAHTAQHLHAGIGADLEYPIHRFFLWAVQLEFSLGGPGSLLASMGAGLAADEHKGMRL